MVTLEIGTKFTINDGAYRNRIFQVLDIDRTASDKQYAFKCENNFGDLQYFSQINLDFYGAEVQIISSNNAEKALASAHVQSVEVAYRGMFDDVRYFDAASNNGRHKYTVKIQDVVNGEETERWARCNCPAGAKDVPCRHILKAAELDSEMTGQDLFLASYETYHAHKTRKQAA